MSAGSGQLQGANKRGGAAGVIVIVCVFVCCLFVNQLQCFAFDRINVMATINVRRRINVAETGHVQAHTIKILGPTSRDPMLNHPHPRQNDPPRTEKPKSADRTKRKQKR